MLILITGVYHTRITFDNPFLYVVIRYMEDIQWVLDHQMFP